MNSISSNKILVTTDFSEASYTAFSYAIERAKATNSAITLFHSVDFPPLLITTLEYMPSQVEMNAIRNEAIKQATEKLTNIAREFFSPVEVTTLVKHHYGGPADDIIDVATKENFSLIVIATHGHGIFRRIFLGNVAERVLRQAKCPVLTVPCKTEEKASKEAHPPYKKIMVTTDFSETSRKAFPLAFEEAKRTRASITVAHVIDSLYDTEILHMKMIYLASAGDIQASYERGLKKKLEQYIPEIDYDLISYELLPKDYSIPNTITEYAKTHGIDLLVISTRGAGNRLNFLGGVAERIVRHCSCPVLVVPPHN